MRSQLALAAVLLALNAVQAAQEVVPNRQPLAPNAFNFLPLTSVKPAGWLLNQLHIQANGLGGHLDEFWADVGPNSGWLGGTGESWERGPYFLDGLVPLAYLTKDPRLIAKVNQWMSWTLDHQRRDGAIGPSKNTDWWPNMVMLKALSQYQEATGDPRVIPLMTRYFAYHLRNAGERPLKEWAKYRWQDEVLSIIWLYNRTGDNTLLTLARTLHDQGHDWEGQFRHFETTAKVLRKEANLDTHGVNQGQALKTAAVWSLVTGDPADREALYRHFGALYQYHGLPNGIFSADEHLAGLDPSQGTELCTVVETMFSFEQILSILGDPAFGDRLEKVAYNPLPGTLSADMWSHQYDQQPNQVECSVAPRKWTTNGPNSNLFGLEPNFGCCTANFHQGWPKLIENLWMGTPTGGLALTVYGPSEVSRRLPNGATLTVNEETGYPFRDSVHLTVNPSRPARFDLQIRIPAWAQQATITVNGRSLTGVRAGTFFPIERQWSEGDRVDIRLPMAVRATQWFNNSVALERGPLVYSLKIAEDWHKLKDNNPPLPSSEWSIFPKSDWNYALVLEPADPASSVTVNEHPIGASPFSPEGAPIELTAYGRQLSSWTLQHEQAASLPVSPVTTIQPKKPVTLIPYGAARLRITAFPWTRN